MQRSNHRPIAKLAAPFGLDGRDQVAPALDSHDHWPPRSCALIAAIAAAMSGYTCINAAILRTACRTVVWSRPPNRRPISGSERCVKVLARDIAIMRGRTTLAVRRVDSMWRRATL